MGRGRGRGEGGKGGWGRGEGGVRRGWERKGKESECEAARRGERKRIVVGEREGEEKGRLVVGKRRGRELEARGNGGGGAGPEEVASAIPLTWGEGGGRGRRE